MILRIINDPKLFDMRELEEIERQRPDGITSQEVVSLFQERGFRFSEATLRKYVQLGLLPTSKRVGRKGKHKGSRGVYPISIVRQINLIKSMMAQDMTLEEIKDSFIFIHSGIEEAGAAIETMFERIEQRMKLMEKEGSTPANIGKAVKEARKQARDMLREVEKVSSQLAVYGSTLRPKDQGGSV